MKSTYSHYADFILNLGRIISVAVDILHFGYTVSSISLY